MLGANSMRYFISSLGKVAVTSVGCTWVRSNFLSLIVISMFGGGGSDGSLACAMANDYVPKPRFTGVYSSLRPTAARSMERPGRKRTMPKGVIGAGQRAKRPTTSRPTVRPTARSDSRPSVRPTAKPAVLPRGGFCVEGVHTGHLECVSLVVRSRGVGLNVFVFNFFGTDSGEECSMEEILHGCGCFCDVAMRDWVGSTAGRGAKAEEQTARGSAEHAVVGIDSLSSDEVESDCDWSEGDFEFEEASSCNSGGMDNGRY